ncbi:MAG: serine protease [Planctomycetota bacterium]
MGLRLYPRNRVREESRRAVLLALVTLAIAAAVSRFATGQCVGGVCPIPQQHPQLYAPAYQPQRANPAVVRVVSGNSRGSGAIVATDGNTSHVLTCWHVVSEGGRLEIRTAGGARAPGRIVAADAKHDLALIQTPALPGSPLQLSAEEPSGPLTIAGYGAGSYRQSTGSVAGYARPLNATHQSVKISTQCRQGDSGGPVINARGLMVGVLWGNEPGLTYATVGQPIRRVIQHLRNRRQQIAQPSPNTQPPADARDGLIPQPTAPPASCECGPKWDALDKRLGKISDQVASLDERFESLSPPKLPSDLVRDGELDELFGDRVPPLVDDWSNRKQVATRNDVATENSKLRDWVSARLKEVAAASGNSWILLAAQTSGPLAVAMLGIGMLKGIRRRRVRRREPEWQPPYPAPQPPTAAPEPHKPTSNTEFVANKYVPYETTDFAEAHKWASQQCATKYPGSVEVLTTLDSLIHQKLQGENRS